MKINFINIRGSVFLFIFLFTSVTLGGCSGRQIILARSRLLMGHVPVNVQIRAPQGQKEQALAASEGAYQEASRLEGLLSEYQEGSEISCLNRQAGRGSCRLSPETYQLLRRAIELNQETEGAFDIRFASKTDRGRHGPIELKGKNREGFLPDPATRLGLGAIAKGYIMEVMSQYLVGQGFPDHLINAGGDLVARGGFWEVALQVPSGTPGQFVDKQKMKNRAVSTSGNYEQGAHILDPLSGQRVQRSGGITVIGSDATTTDALATAFFVLGREKTETMIKNFPGLEAIWLEPVVQRP